MPSKKSSTERELTPKQKSFVNEYLVDLNATQAAIRAGYSAKTAEWIGPQLLTKSHVAEAVSERMKERESRTEITQDMVLKRYWQIASADPNELIQYRRNCCRHCFGEGHEFQWVDEEEYLRAVDRESKAAAEKGRDPEPISAAGGFGFDPSILPHPKCPSCHGEGFGSVFASDTRNLSESARALYAGVKVTKDGLEVKMHDQLAALRDVGRHLGMFKDKLEHSGPGGGAIQSRIAVEFVNPPVREDDE